MGKDLEFAFGWNDTANNANPWNDQHCMGLLVCPHCGRSAMCGDVAKHVPTNRQLFSDTQENDNMIPRNTGNSSGGQRGGGRKRGSGLPFLAPDKASTVREPGKIIAARVENDNYRQGEQMVALKINFRNQLFLYNLRSNNPTLDALCNAFGDDELQWAGKHVVIFNEVDDFNGKTWLRIEPDTDATQTSDRQPRRGKT